MVWGWKKGVNFACDANCVRVQTKENNMRVNQKKNKKLREANLAEKDAKRNTKS